MRFDVLTLFPGMFPSYLGQSVLRLAIECGLVDVVLHDIRDWADDRHRTVDDRPFGGGPGMVLKVEPVVRCVEEVRGRVADPGHLVMLTPQGRRLDQSAVERLASHDRLLLLCGRYEGFDERVRQILHPDEISIGDYILGGGEVAAMVMIDAVVAWCLAFWEMRRAIDKIRFRGSTGCSRGRSTRDPANFGGSACRMCC